MNRIKSVHRRRGATYVFFLGTSMLLTIIGASALVFVRIDRRMAQGSHDRIAARMYAEAGIAHGQLVIQTDPDWRDRYEHGVWQSSESISDGTFAWMLTDDERFDLKSNRNAPVRLHGRGVCGTSSWTYSVLIQPLLETAPSSVLTNGDVEDAAVAPWTTYGTCSLQVDATAPHAGTACLRITGRTAGSAASQPLTGIATGTTCGASVWVRTTGGVETIWSGLQVESDSGTEYLSFGQLAVDGSWTQLTGNVTPMWSGDIQKLIWVIGADSTAEFFLDDASLVPLPGTFGPLAGTWQREVE